MQKNGEDHLACLIAGDATRLTSAVIVRLFCICSVLLPGLAGVAFGEGAYQRTKDGKTIVWNNDPKPGEAAAWFGDRDRERYATKVGTLTWYTANGAVYVRYFGNMVRGKFNGMVNVHFNGKTDHAIFVDGQQTTRWADGRAPSRRVPQLPALRPAKPAVAAEGPAEGSPTVRKTENAQRPALSAAQVAPTRPRNGAPKLVRERAAGPTPNSESVPEQVAQPPIEDTPVKELSEQRAGPATPAVTSKPASAELPPTNSPARQAGVTEPEPPAAGPGVVQAENALATSANSQTRRGQASSSPGEQRATPTSQSFPEQAAQPAMEDAPAKKLSEQPAGPATPAVISKPASAVLPPTNSPAPQAGVTEPEAPAEGPRVAQAESALATSANRQTRRGEASSSSGEQPATPSSQTFRPTQPPMEDTPPVLIQPPEKSVPTPPTSKKSQAEIEDSLQSLAQPPSSLLAVPEIAASPEASPRLTKAEVINIANAKARTHGYNRTDYRRPEPQYNAAYKIWSVSYERRVADGREEAGEHFSVIVDDKTKGTVLLLRR